MPNNKKGQGKKGRKKSGSKAARDNGQQPTLLQRIQSTLPAFQGMKVAANHDAAAKSGGYYNMYKEATLNFHNWMAKEACPDFKMSAVNDYRKGVQYILDHNMKLYLTKEETQSDDLIAAPRAILASLVLSIRLREKVTAGSFGSKDGGDLGHRYIIDVLKYCQGALRFANRIANAVYSVKEEDEKVKTSIGGRFSALALDDDEDDEMDWEDVDRDIKDGNLPKYTGVEVQEEIDIKEALLKGDDRFQSIAFLHTMDDFMGDIQEHYGLLKSYMRGNRSAQPASGCLHLLMECAVVANVAIDNVNRAENELTMEHPHLSSFYHVLALVIWPEVVAEINKLIDTTKLKKNPHMALQFVAEVVECSFYDNSEVKKRFRSSVYRFTKKSGLELQVVDYFAALVDASTALETILVSEECDVADVAGVQPHTWFSHTKYIGGDFCILNTQKIVQVVSGMMKDMKIPGGERGAWGPPFDENTHPARRIWGDLDEAFVTRILPELFLVCESAPFDELPGELHLTKVLTLLRRHAKGDLTKPVPIALSFGLHAVLMSIFVIQGDGDLARVAASTKQSYNRLFEQWQTVADRSKSPDNSPSFYADIRRFGCFEELAKLVPTEVDQGRTVDAHEVEMVNPYEAEILAFWNPLIGGEYLLFATYICSLRLGCSAIDSLGQLRSALHLYNALRLCDPTLNIPFLQTIDTVFKNIKQVWPGGKPEKGSFSKMFWISMGTNPKRARLASICTADQDVILADHRIWLDDGRRKVDWMRPADFSGSYRRLVEQDFGSEDLENLYMNRYAKASEEKCYGYIFDPAPRLRTTLDCMHDDRDDVLPVNFAVVGSILLEFMNALSDHMGWSRLIQETVRKKEAVSSKTVRGNTTKSLAASGLDFKHKFLIEFWGELLSFIDKGGHERLILLFDADKISTFAKSFFEKVEKTRYIFLVEEKNDSASNR